MAAELTDISRGDELDDIAGDANVPGNGRVLVMERIEAVKAKEIVQTRRIDIMVPGVGFLVELAHPETCRHGQRHEVPEVLAGVAEFHPVAEILTSFAAIVVIGAKPLRKPDGMYIDKAECKFCSLGDACLIDIGYIVENLYIFHDFLILFFAELIGLGIEP